MYVADHQAKRDSINEEIQNLNKARREFVAAKQKEAGDADAETLDQAVVRTVREQAEKKGYRFEK